MRESDILYETERHWIKRNARGDYEVYRIGVTHSTRCATIGKGLANAFERAKQEIERREKE